ncbi:NmrA family NAD(P)-binding protein, partial [Streptomyces sp. WM6386]
MTGAARHVLVTGASGYIGGPVAQALLAAGHRVTGLVRDPSRAAELAAAG